MGLDNLSGGKASDADNGSDPLSKQMLEPLLDPLAESQKPLSPLLNNVVEHYPPDSKLVARLR